MLSVRHLRVFGSITYVKTLCGSMKKLTNKSKPIIFVGYELRSKPYHCFDLESQKVHVSRVIVFDKESK